MYEPFFANVFGHTLLAFDLNSESRVVDAGANVGKFSMGMTKYFNNKPYCLEPQTTAREELAHRDCSRCVLPYALAGTDRDAVLHINSNSEASSIEYHSKLAESMTGVETVACISLPSLMRKLNLGGLDVLKLDIEGSEIEVLESTPIDLLKEIHQISVEYHDWLYPEHTARIKRINTRLKKAGFVRLVFSRSGLMDVLYVSPRIQQLGRINMLALRLHLSQRRIRYSVGMCLGLGKRERRLSIRRMISSSQRSAFSTWTDPAGIGKWFSLPQARLVSIDLDPRLGGTYRLKWRWVASGDSLYLTGRFIEFDPPKRIVSTWYWLDYWPPSCARPSDTRLTVTFRKVSSSTEVRIIHELFSNKKDRDAHMIIWNGALDRLEKLFF